MRTPNQKKLLQAIRDGNAVETQFEERPAVYAALKKFSADAGLPMPRFFSVPMEYPNALILGERVAFTTGYTALMNDRELIALLEHEIGHQAWHPGRVLQAAPALTALTCAAAAATTAHTLKGKSEKTEKLTRRAFLVGGAGALAAHVPVENAAAKMGENTADDMAVTYGCDPEALASAFRKLDAWAKAHGDPGDGRHLTFEERIERTKRIGHCEASRGH